MSNSHTSTQEWQRYESDMRRRRADRLLIRATAALDFDLPDAAKKALAEAQELCPEHPDLEEVSARLSAVQGLSVRSRQPAAPWLLLLLRVPKILTTSFPEILATCR